MRDEDRKALKIFRETIVAQSAPAEAITFYAQVLKGDAASRKAWVLTKGLDLETLDPAVKAFLMSDIVLSKEDLAVIIATQAVTELKPTVTGFWAWSWWPWNWRIK